MIALFSFVPSHCPNCAKEFLGADDKYHRQDWFAGCACTCPKCGLHYSYAPAEPIRVLAAEHGDMGRYVLEGEAD